MVDFREFNFNGSFVTCHILEDNLGSHFRRYFMVTFFSDRCFPSVIDEHLLLVKPNRFHRG